jgi:uncharacterized membrane protein
MVAELLEFILDGIEVAALAIEVLAVGIIVFAVVFGMVEYGMDALRGGQSVVSERYTAYKTTLGRALLLGLEILVAADIIKTVALETTFESVAILGLLVIIRIFLGWSLIVEIEGRWPWQPERPENNDDGASDQEA